MLKAQRFEFDAHQLVLLYRQRWEIELGFREIKQSLQQSHSVLRSRHPELVIHEVWCSHDWPHPAERVHAADARGEALRVPPSRQGPSSPSQVKRPTRSN